MEPYINILATQDQLGVHVTVAGNGLNARLHFVNHPNPVAALTDQVDHLKSEILSFSENAKSAMETLSEKGWKAKVPGELGKVAAAFRALREAAISRRKEIDARRIDLLRPLQPLDPMKAYEIRQWIRTQKAPEVVPIAIKNPEIAAAILDFKVMSGIPGDLLVLIENALIKHNLMQKYASGTQLKATANDVLAHGVDLAEVTKMAEKGVENIELGTVELEYVETVLSGTIHFYAIAAMVPRDEAFKMIMG